MKNRCKEGEADEGTGRKAWEREGLVKGDPNCQRAEAAQGTTRKEGVTWEVVVEVAGGKRVRSGARLERKGKSW